MSCGGWGRTTVTIRALRCWMQRGCDAVQCDFFPRAGRNVWQASSFRLSVESLRRMLGSVPRRRCMRSILTPSIHVAFHAPRDAYQAQVGAQLLAIAGRRRHLSAPCAGPCPCSPCPWNVIRWHQPQTLCPLFPYRSINMHSTGWFGKEVSPCFLRLHFNCHSLFTPPPQCATVAVRNEHLQVSCAAWGAQAKSAAACRAVGRCRETKPDQPPKI